MVCFRKKEGNVIKSLKLFSSLFVRQKTSHPFRAVSYPSLRCVEKDYERFNPRWTIEIRENSAPFSSPSLISAGKSKNSK